MERVFISIGTNIERRKHLKFALDALYGRWGSLQLSSVYESEAVGFVGDDFYNMVVGFKTTDSIADLNTEFKAIELEGGRDRHAAKFSARTIDIDLLNYGDKIYAEPVALPRAEILHNAFVLLPFYELAPDWIHPEQGVSLSKLWQAFDQHSQPLKKIEDPIDMSPYKQ
ncbi:2-amino-4-hydroxy-6-hydroxymethyldihydropteridine diphosphokinase [Pleionea sp. CnH1-48]|uniref:2-amino-4-hydroxy-6- hydroxymethyldihydropteridine diphosphokinase n=1 Tax=Pleionea sp. CnH1-48 TaxID=2954494 RepID=UPI002097DC10|nr:2-amino-4-hydroxy-6-hydroxymethyldihydropteridine diphosphokinase [Pleionea sp. CnH1-48]